MMVRCLKECTGAAMGGSGVGFGLSRGMKNQLKGKEGATLAVAC